eukprot:876500-Amphidinium_carterae.1
MSTRVGRLKPFRVLSKFCPFVHFDPLLESKGLTECSAEPVSCRAIESVGLHVGEQAQANVVVASCSRIGAVRFFAKFMGLELVSLVWQTAYGIFALAVAGLPMPTGTSH